MTLKNLFARLCSLPAEHVRTAIILHYHHLSILHAGRLQEDMKQWALDMDEPPPSLAHTAEEEQAANMTSAVLQEAAGLTEQGSDADETAASQQGSLQSHDSFQEAGQYWMQQWSNALCLSDVLSALSMGLTLLTHHGRHLWQKRSALHCGCLCTCKAAASNDCAAT